MVHLPKEYLEEQDGDFQRLYEQVKLALTCREEVEPELDYPSVLVKEQADLVSGAQLRRSQHEEAARLVADDEKALAWLEDHRSEFVDATDDLAVEARRDECHRRILDEDRYPSRMQDRWDMAQGRSYEMAQNGAISDRIFRSYQDFEGLKGLPKDTLLYEDGEFVHSVSDLSETVNRSQYEWCWPFVGTYPGPIKVHVPRLLSWTELPDSCLFGDILQGCKQWLKTQAMPEGDKWHLMRVPGKVWSTILREAYPEFAALHTKVAKYAGIWTCQVLSGIGKADPKMTAKAEKKWHQAIAQLDAELAPKVNKNKLMVEFSGLRFRSRLRVFLTTITKPPLLRFKVGQMVTPDSLAAKARMTKKRVREVIEKARREEFRQGLWRAHVQLLQDTYDVGRFADVKQVHEVFLKHIAEGKPEAEVQEKLTVLLGEADVELAESAI